MKSYTKILFLAALVGVAVARQHGDDSSEMEGNDRRPWFARRRDDGFMRPREHKPDSDEDDRDEPRRPPFGGDDKREGSGSEEERPRPKDRDGDDDDKEMRERPMRRGPWFGRRRMMERREGDEDRFGMRSRRPQFREMFGFRDEQSPRFSRRKSYRRPDFDDNDDEDERRPRIRRFGPRFDSEEEDQQDDDDNMRNEMRESRGEDDDDSEGRWFPRHHRRHGRHGRRHHGRFPPCHRRGRHHRRHRPWMSWSRDSENDDERDTHRNMMIRMFMFHRMMQMRREMEQNRDDNSNIYSSRFWKQPSFYPQMQSGNNQQSQFSQNPQGLMMYLGRQGMALPNNNDNTNNNNDNSPLPAPPGINLSFQPQGPSNPDQTFYGSTGSRPFQINEPQFPQTNTDSPMDSQDMQNMVPNAREQPLPEPPGIAISTTTQSTTSASEETA